MKPLAMTFGDRVKSAIDAWHKRCYDYGKREKSGIHPCETAAVVLR